MLEKNMINSCELDMGKYLENNTIDINWVRHNTDALYKYLIENDAMIRGLFETNKEIKINKYLKPDAKFVKNKRTRELFFNLTIADMIEAKSLFLTNIIRVLLYLIEIELENNIGEDQALELAFSEFISKLKRKIILRFDTQIMPKMKYFVMVIPMMSKICAYHDRHSTDVLHPLMKIRYYLWRNDSLQDDGGVIKCTLSNLNGLILFNIKDIIDYVYLIVNAGFCMPKQGDELIDEDKRYFDPLINPNPNLYTDIRLELDDLYTLSCQILLAFLVSFLCELIVSSKKK